MRDFSTIHAGSECGREVTGSGCDHVAPHGKNVYMQRANAARQRQILLGCCKKRVLFCIPAVIELEQKPELRNCNSRHRRMFLRIDVVKRLCLRVVRMLGIILAGAPLHRAAAAAVPGQSAAARTGLLEELQAHGVTTASETL